MESQKSKVFQKSIIDTVGRKVFLALSIGTCGTYFGLSRSSDLVSVFLTHLI